MKEAKKTNQLTVILFNIVIPVLILTKLSSEEHFGPVNGLIAALAFPAGFFLYELIVQKQKNFISIIGFVGVLLTGSIGLFEFPAHWIAIKEAAIPAIIGIFILISTKTKWQLIKKFIYNPDLLNIEKIEEKTASSAELNTQVNKTLERANIFLAGSFFISAVLNYILAKIIVTSPSGTEAFNQEVGKMTGLSYPIIAIPSVIILILIFYYLTNSLKKITQLDSKELFSEKLNK